MAAILAFLALPAGVYGHNTSHNHTVVSNDTMQVGCEAQAGVGSGIYAVTVSRFGR